MLWVTRIHHYSQVILVFFALIVREKERPRVKPGCKSWRVLMLYLGDLCGIMDASIAWLRITNLGYRSAIWFSLDLLDLNFSDFQPIRWSAKMGLIKTKAGHYFYFPHWEGFLYLGESSGKYCLKLVLVFRKSLYGLK